MRPAFIARPIRLLRMQCPAAIRTPPGADHRRHRLEAIGTIWNIEVIHPRDAIRLTGNTTSCALSPRCPRGSPRRKSTDPVAGGDLSRS